MKKRAVLRFLERWYLPALFFVWTFSPEVRRLVDWQTGFHQFSPFSILPLVFTLPGLALLPLRWKSLGKGYRAAACLWLVGFGFAYLVAVAMGSMFSGTYSLIESIMPVGIGALVFATTESFESVYNRVASAVLWCAAISSVYAIYQYVALPPWDAFWMQNANIVSQGSPVAYGFRVYGTFNSTGPFAQLIINAVLLNLPRLRTSKVIPTLLLAPCMIALVLTMVRLAWVGLAVAIPVYILLSPRKRGSIVAFGSVLIAFVLVGGVLVNVVPNASIGLNATVDRLATFQDLQSDSSVSARQQESGDAWVQGFRDPLGGGLGSSDNATKLSGGDGGGLDNGYLSALVQMGVFGWITFLLALVVGLWTSVSAYSHARQRGAPTAGTLAAAAVTFQVLLLILEAGFSNHAAYSGIFFWLTIYMAEASRRLADVEREERLQARSRPLIRGFAA